MKAAITIVDKNLGLTFNNRPLSRDKKLYEYTVALATTPID